MKKIFLLLTVVFLSIASNAQEENEYSLEGLAKACSNYYEMSPFHNGRAVVKKADEHYNIWYGVIDKQGNEVIPCRYELINDFCDDVAVVKGNNGKYGVVDIQGNEIAPCKFDFIENFSDGVAFVGKYVDNDNMSLKFGVIDKQGKIIIPFNYDVIERDLIEGKFYKGVAVVGKMNDNYCGWGVINKQGKEMIPCAFRDINITEDIAIFVDGNNTYGAVDLQRKIIVAAPTKYGYIGHFKNGYATIRKEDHFGSYYYGVINKDGKEIVPCKYKSVGEFENGYAIIENIIDGKRGTGLIDSLGRELLPCIYKNIGKFTEGLVLAETKKEMGNQKMFIDKNGETAFVLNSNYCKVKNFVDGLCEVWESPLGTTASERAGFIDKTGNVIVPLKYKYVMNPSEGLCAVKNEENKWGYIDKKGNVVIPFNYITAFPFVDGIAIVELGIDKWTIIDKRGNHICKYAFASMDFGNFSEGLAVVKKDGKYGYMDKQGRCTFEY